MTFDVDRGHGAVVLAALVGSGGTLAPQGQENSGHGAVVLLERHPSEDSGITRHTFTRERRASSRQSARRHRRGRVPHQFGRPRKRNGR